MNELDNIVREFLVESYENLDQLDRDLVSLETDPHDRKRLASIFRTIHTIKGTCGFFGFSKLESVAHVGESLLSRLRDGLQELTAESTTGLLKLVDAVREMLSNIEKNGQEGDGDYSGLIALLQRLQQPNAASPAETPESHTEDSHAAPSPVEAVTPSVVVEAPVHAEPVPVVVQSQPVQSAPPQAVAPTTTSAPANTPPAAPHADAKASESGSVSVSESNIRVDVGLLDRLMNLVGELVLARNQVLKYAGQLRDTGFLSTMQRLNLITSELQEGVMKTRMQPIGNIWDRFPRVVRDLSSLCGKQVRLEMDGRDTELDRTIIEAIKDPLTHVVRNSIDHGFELPERRVAVGKPPYGTLRLRAFHEGGQVNIEISDDGAGIPPDKVKAKAVEKGLITREQAARMADREAIQLIYLPGFSTAEKVTNISGRGVGMDVVKTNIEKIGGTLDVQSEQGFGTTLKVKIPLTLAIIPALTVTCAGDRYAIPQVNLLELVRVDGEIAGRSIENVNGAPVYRLRGRLLPLVHLNRELGLPDPVTPPEAVSIVVLQADDHQFGLVVEGICDTEEIVVKPLCKALKALSVYAGATIMGDGRVALILDVVGIAQRSGLLSAVRTTARDEQASDGRVRDADHAPLLLLAHGERQLAVPLSLVSRMEEIPASAVEQSDGVEVVQYRGQIMPLLRLGHVYGESEHCDVMQVVIYAHEGKFAGLVVDRILDIVTAASTPQRSSSRGGILGSAVIQNRVTDLLDMPAMIQATDPSFFDPMPGGPA